MLRSTETVMVFLASQILFRSHWLFPWSFQLKVSFFYLIHNIIACKANSAVKTIESCNIFYYGSTMVFSESHCKFILCCFMSHLSRYTINSSMARVIFLNACGILPLLAQFRIPSSWHPALLKVLPVAWIESSLAASVHVRMETIFDLWGRGVGIPASVEASKQVTWTRILFPMNLRWGFSSVWSEHGRWLTKSLVDGQAR